MTSILNGKYHNSQDFHGSLKKSLSKTPPTFAEDHMKARNHIRKVDNEYLSDDDEEILHHHGIYGEHRVLRNPSAALLYEKAIKLEKGSQITSSGALATLSGKKTGRSPQDKRIVEEDITKDDIWWGKVNIKLSEKTFMVNRERAIDYLNTQEHLYVVDGFAGWDGKYRIKVRVITSRAYHALFMQNMLIKPTDEELKVFGEPDYIIYNAGRFPANTYTAGMTSNASVVINFKKREMVILGTEYAGEMKKGVFTIMNYLMPKQGVLSLHSSCNEGEKGDVTLFFGLSGTGKTTLSADPNRILIGDDEHVWTEDGVFNIEGGCYAKCIGLRREKEPEIYDAIRFGSVLENVVIDSRTRNVFYDSDEITENTRCAYPLEYIPNAKLPPITTHPTNIILLTCDAFGVLPPVSKLTVEQAMYHFINGYTSKVAGTEVGITEPTATFSSCFGEPFIVWHPVKYAELLAEKLKNHKAHVWLVNTGWIGGSTSKGGSRISLKYTRAIIDAIHSGELLNAKLHVLPVFNLHVPVQCSGIPDEILIPQKSWQNEQQYFTELKKLGSLFIKNFERFSEKASKEIIKGGPQL